MPSLRPAKQPRCARRLVRAAAPALCAVGLVLAGVAGAGPASAGPASVEPTGVAATITVENVALEEGDSDFTAFVFTLVLAEAVPWNTEVDWHTEDGTATAPEDYTAVMAGMATIPAGELSTTVTVDVLGDTVVENDESFTISYTERVVPRTTTSATSQPDTEQRAVAQSATGTVADDDTPPSSDLKLTNISNPAPVVVGQDVTYTIAVLNDGPDTAAAVEITDQLDESVVYVFGTVSLGCGALAALSCRPQAVACAYDTVVTCLAGNLWSGGVATATVVARTTSTTFALPNLASVSSSTADPDESSNSAWDYNFVASDAFGCTIVGSNTNDKLIGTAGPDIICGRGGSDELHGGEGNDQLRGGAGGDLLYPEGGDDVLLGGSGDDYLFSSAGDDKLDGEGGADFSVYAWDPAGVRVDLRTGTGLDGFGGTDLITSAGRLYGSPFNDVLHGSSLPDGIDGREGDDTILGHGRNDLLYGRQGADSLNGGPGVDECELAQEVGDVLVSCEGEANRFAARLPLLPQPGLS